MAFLPAGYAEIHRTAPNRPLHAVRFSPRRIPYRRSIRRIRRARRHPRTPRASDAHTHTHRNSGKTTLTVSHGTTEARTGLPARSRPFHRQSTPIRPILCSTNPTAQNASCTPRAGRGLALKHEKFLCPGPVKPSTTPSRDSPFVQPLSIHTCKRSKTNTTTPCLSRALPAIRPYMPCAWTPLCANTLGSIITPQKPHRGSDVLSTPPPKSPTHPSISHPQKRSSIRHSRP